MSIDFEKELMRGIPADLAADFFIRIKGTVRDAETSIGEKWASLSSEEQDEVLALAREEGLLPKEANMGGATGAPPSLPPTAKGQNMMPAPAASLPPTAMGENAVKMGASAQERAHDQIEVAHEKHRHSGGERVGKHLGTLAGAAAGAAAGHKAGGHGALGAAMGALAGRSLGKDVGKSHDVKHFHEKFKHAAAKLGFAGNLEGNLPPEAEVGNVPDIHQYLAAEEMGGAAEEANAAEYYKQRFQEAMQQLQGVQEQADQAGAMAEQLQGQVSGSQEQIQSAMQQAQIASQAAMDNVMQAHQMAMDATAQAMKSQEQVLQQKQLAAAMKMGITQVKDQVMSALASDPTDALAQQLTSPPPGSGGMVGAGANQTPSGPGGAPDQAAGGMQNASSQAATQGTSATEQTQGAADQAAGSESAPNVAGSGESGEEVSDARSGKSEGPGSSSTSKGSTKVEIKQGSVKLSGLLPPLSLPGAVGGAALGAGIGAAYAHSSNDKLRSKVNELEAVKGRSFSQAFDLAQSKARLALGEASEEHPLATTLLAGAQGAMTGALAGPQTLEDFGETGKNFRKAWDTLKGAA